MIVDQSLSEIPQAWEDESVPQDVVALSNEIIWRITERDIAESDLLFGAMLQFAPEEAPFPSARRIVAVGNEKLSEGRAALLCAEGLTAPAQADASVRIVLAADERDRETLENDGLNVPCIVIGLGITATPPDLWPSKGPDLTFALVDEDPDSVRLVCMAFREAFDPSDPVRLIICSIGLAHHASLLEIVSESVHHNVTVCRIDALRRNGGRGPLPFDLLLTDAIRNRQTPLSIAAAEHGRAVPLRLDASSAMEGPAAEMAAAHMRSVARSFLARGAFPEHDLVALKDVQDRIDVASWTAKARVLDQIVTCQGPEPARLGGIGWVTRWNVKCGIGDHAAHQVAVAEGRNIVLAPHEGPLLGPDGGNVLRCWAMGLGDNGFGALLDAVYREDLATIIFHFNWGFYEPAALGRLVADLRAAGRVVVIDFHSTASSGAYGLRLRDFAECLGLFDRVLVHQLSDLERVRAVAPDAKIIIEPLAINTGPARLADRNQSPLIGCFGFCLPNKGIEQLVAAFGLLRQSNEDVRLLLLNAEHPAAVSAKTVSAVRGLIESLGLSNVVDFVTDYLEENECIERLSKTSLIVNPYQYTSESASAAARYALASGTPVLVTPLPIFTDLGEAVFRASGTRPQQLCDSIRTTLAKVQENAEHAVSVAAAAERWRDIHDITKQTHRLMALTTAIGRNRRFQNWARFGARG